MARYFRGIGYIRWAFIGSVTPNYDQVSTPGYENEKEEPRGLDGIRQLFKLDKNGDVNPELNGLINTSIASTLLGGLYGAAKGSRVAFHNFIETNEATKFANHLDAKRKLQDTVIMAMCKKGLKWAVKIGSFSTIFLTSVTLIAAYLGGKGMTEYCLAGLFTGALYKMNMGIRGMIAGGIVGCSLGTFTGAIFNFIFWMTGTSLRELNEVQKEIQALRKKIAFSNLRKDTEKEFGPEHADTNDDNIEQILGETKK